MSVQDGGDDISVFVNRVNEHVWLRDRAFDRARWRKALGIVGPPGIGKSALIRNFVAQSLSRQGECLSLTGRLSVWDRGGELDLDKLDYLLRDAREREVSNVVIDDADVREKDLERLIRVV